MGFLFPTSVSAICTPCLLGRWPDFKKVLEPLECNFDGIYECVKKKSEIPQTCVYQDKCLSIYESRTKMVKYTGALISAVPEQPWLNSVLPSI